MAGEVYRAYSDTPVWWPTESERRAEHDASERRRERAREARRRVTERGER